MLIYAHIYDKRFRWFFEDAYFYAEILRNNRENIIITYLFVDKLEAVIPSKLIQQKKNLNIVDKETKIQNQICLTHQK